MRLTVDKHLMVPMRDGVMLATDLYRIDDDRPRPALLARLPYNKDSLALLANPVLPDLFRLVETGYAVVIQDVRGTSRSEGAFDPMVNEAEDGHDTITWVTAQPWCDGRVGMYGGSYLGFTQWLVAAAAPDALAAFAPAFSSSNHHRGAWYHDGVFELANSHGWSTSMALAGALRRADGDDDLAAGLAIAALDPSSLWDRLPLTDQPELEKDAPWYRLWLDHPEYDDFWRSTSLQASYDELTIPGLHIAGWYDSFLGPSLDGFSGMRRHGGTVRARESQRLLIGPWTHADQTGVYPDRSFGPSAGIASCDITGMHLDFFDWAINGTKDTNSRVRIFVMGADEWRDVDDWPIPGTQHVPYFISSAGQANTADGDGFLVSEHARSAGVDTLRYDPRHPVPTVGGYMFGLPHCPAGPADQTEVERREDVLCYSTPALSRPVEVAGHVELIVFVSTNGHDTDITAKLVDVFPDGRAINLCEGVTRLRYRRSTTYPERVEPDEVYELRVDLWATSNVFLPGHRIRLEISSSNYPRFNRNTNTGGTIAMETEAQFVAVDNRIHHGGTYPSRLMLPIVDLLAQLA